MYFCDVLNNVRLYLCLLGAVEKVKQLLYSCLRCVLKIQNFLFIY